MRVRATQRSFHRCCLTEELGLRLLECGNATHSADDYYCERLVDEKIIIAFFCDGSRSYSLTTEKMS